MTLSSRTAPACLAAALALSLAGASAAVAGPPGSADAGPAVTPRPPAAPAPVEDVPVRTTPRAGTPLPGQYVVVFRPGTRGAKDLARTLTRQSGGQLLHTYEHALQGFAARLPEGRAAALRRNPDVALVEQDAVATVADTQTGATWGLDRSDQRTRPLDGSWTDGNEGVGVHVYVVDTGVLGTHAEFAGRMGNGYDAVTAGGSATDCNGHGTHVAGTAAGATYGIADKATVHPVRVLGCTGSGSNSGVIAGVDWVRANHVKPAVANMSLGGGASAALDTAVSNAITAGVTFAVAAGNENVDACGGSPSRVAAAVTVGATTSTDARSSFSNYGTCLDLFAPGSSITSAWHTGTTATNTISGTSMATPHVAGAAALHLSANRTATPAAVRSALVTAGTTGLVTGAGAGSPNVLLHTTPLSGGTTTPPPPAPSSLLNGGFESGTTGWSQSDPAIISTSGRVRSGSWSAWLGSYDGANEVVAQTVTVPSSGATLRWSWQLSTSEPTGTRAYDLLHARVHSTSGTLLATLVSRSNTSTRDAWVADSASLAQWAGQTVSVRFVATNDSSYPSSFFVDDVTLG